MIDLSWQEELYKITNEYPGFYRGWEMPEKEILKLFHLCDAFWMHDGDPAKPHAELTSGKCSNGFIDCLRVLQYRNLSQILADQLAQKVRKLVPYTIQVTIGSPMAGIYFADDLGEALNAPIRLFTEKDPKNPGKMLWNRIQLRPEYRVLQVEELTTTSKTLNAVFEAVNEGNGGPVEWVPCVAILVHRPPKLPVTHYGDRQVIALIEKEIWAVDPAECPLCAAGSKRLRPKQNWAELTGKK
jgi:orotate phosphoribosyltransferase